ncbi:hypothetical protein R5R35_001150 [Gryllus longicercus]|uniref:CHK kinase-like domain-containing protein n=1 Tax=Gryllus longicercus TaxID=2509291 RepID=A0AAN9W749_9ORTH
MGDQTKVESQQNGVREPPSWINKELIQVALCNAEEENPQVAAISVCCPAAAGDNYASTIYRAKATLSNGKERSLIIKGPAPGVTVSSIARESGLFQREITMLVEVIPQMEALLEEAAPGRFPPLAPRCYHHGTSPVEFLVLEDLAPSGFTIADRKRGLGLRHTLLALRTLARFHAASFALLKRQPEVAETLPNIWRKIFESNKEFVEVEIRGAANACRSWPGFEKYADPLEKFKFVALDTYSDLNEAKPEAFNVITHGDFWVNNMMFRYEDGKVKEHRAIDLQISHVASPAADLVYFLSGSLSSNVHEQHQDLLLREYHHELKETLELLGLQAPSLEELLTAVDLHGPLSLIMTMGLPFMKADRGVDLEAIMGGDVSAVVPLFELPDVKKWIQRVLPDYVRRGWLRV